ncbi:MAG: hypothetical protein JW808_10390 [Victivallales bacterium]|nr:hypothetical protein [Victivallales bacterium]
MGKDFKLEIYKSPRTVFRLRDIAILLGDSDFDNLKAKINYYVLRGVIRNIRKGIYVKDSYSAEELACRLYVPSYVSLDTVLLRHGVIFQYTGEITAISYLSRRLTVDGNGITYRKIKNRVLVNPEGLERVGNVNIASKERALLDSLYLNKESYFDNLNGIDRVKLEQISRIYNCKALTGLLKRLFDDA